MSLYVYCCFSLSFIHVGINFATSSSLRLRCLYEMFRLLDMAFSPGMVSPLFLKLILRSSMEVSFIIAISCYILCESSSNPFIIFIVVCPECEVFVLFQFQQMLHIVVTDLPYPEVVFLSDSRDSHIYGLKV